jgi:hypothetical protein
LGRKVSKKTTADVVILTEKKIFEQGVLVGREG